MIIKKTSFLALVICSLWLGMTIAVDFVSIPLAFQTIPNSEIAGQLGLRVFSRFNLCEMVFGVLLVLTLSSWLRLVGLVHLMMASFYTFYLTPKIQVLTAQMHSFAEESVDFLKVEAVHQFYHKLYVNIDSVKLLLLLVLIGILFYQSWKTEKKGQAL